MDKTKMSMSSSVAITSKVATCHPLFGDRVKRAIRKVSIEFAREVQEVVRILRIMTFLYSAKDLSSVLRLYGIEDSGACANPNEM
jgi:hypothetical protein